MLNDFYNLYFLQHVKDMNFDGQFIYPITTKDRQWLVNALQSPLAKNYLTEEELEALLRYLPSVEPFDVIEKGLPDVEVTYNIVHFQEILNAVCYKKGLRVNINNVEACIYAYRLQYSTKSLSWQLVAFDLKEETIHIVPLQIITIIEECEVPEQIEKMVEFALQKMERKANIVINEHKLIDHFAAEKTRILNTFASYNKRIIKKRNKPDYYEIEIDYYEHQEEEILTLIHQLGNRVKLIAPKSLQQKFILRLKDTLTTYK